MPEGVIISIADTVPGEWTATRVADMLRANAYQLADLGQNLKVKVQTTYATGTSGVASAGQDGNYFAYKATIYLDARSTSAFLARPDIYVAHEYGHFWANYWMFLKHQGSLGDFLRARGIDGDPFIGTTYGWLPSEIIADDYRFLFGTQTAIDQLGHVNKDLPDPRAVPGLAGWFSDGWA